MWPMAMTGKAKSTARLTPEDGNCRSAHASVFCKPVSASAQTGYSTGKRVAAGPLFLPLSSAIYGHQHPIDSISLQLPLEDSSDRGSSHYACPLHATSLYVHRNCQDSMNCSRALCHTSHSCLLFVVSTLTSQFLLYQCQCPPEVQQGHSKCEPDEGSFDLKGSVHCVFQFPCF